MRTRQDILADLLGEALEDRAELDPDVRKAAANGGAGAPEPVRALAEKIHRGGWNVTEADIAAARSAGLSEDQVFETIIAASLGAAKKRFDAAMTALAAASAGERKRVSS